MNLLREAIPDYIQRGLLARANRIHGLEKPGLLESMRIRDMVDNAPIGSVGAPGGAQPPPEHIGRTTDTDLLGLLTGAGAVTPGPIGDVLGPAHDIRHLINNPESRTPLNFGLTGLGMLPLIPSIGMTVFHGSPHKFDFFDKSKIGTGEGAQAYGHGLYFAENPNVAKQYQLTPGTYAALEQRAKDAGLDVLEYQKKLRSGEIAEPASHLYEVDIPDEAIANMLDWDKPFSDVPVSVKKELAHLLPNVRVLGDAAGGGAIYEALARQLGGAEEASKWFAARGIPGIKYYDQGSRAAGEGTRNIVLFDEKLAKILKRD